MRLGILPQGQYMLGRLSARQSKYDPTSTLAWKHGQEQLAKKYPKPYDRAFKDIPLNNGYGNQKNYDEYAPNSPKYAKAQKERMQQNYNDYKADPNALDNIK